MTILKPPADLQAAGKKLWKDATSDFDLNPSELALLREASRTLDELEVLRAAVLDSDLITKGSTGQPVVNKLFEEVRKHRDSLNKTLIALALPMGDEDEAKPPTVKQLRAKKAADARWGSKRAEESRRQRFGNGTA